MSKKEFVMECLAVMNKPNVGDWYEHNLTGTDLADTFRILEEGISKGEITIHDALVLAAIIGLDFHEIKGE
jgi:hypothetical protein